jgi:hypothetical protein
MDRVGEVLVGPGRISAALGGEPAAEGLVLEVAFTPDGDAIRVDAVDTGVEARGRVCARISAARFAEFVHALRAALAEPPGDGGGQGFWVEQVVIELPLASGMLAATARPRDAAPSAPVAACVLDLLDAAARAPGAEVVRPPGPKANPWLLAALYASMLVGAIWFTWSQC